MVNSLKNGRTVVKTIFQALFVTVFFSLLSDYVAGLPPALVEKDLKLTDSEKVLPSLRATYQLSEQKPGPVDHMDKIIEPGRYLDLDVDHGTGQSSMVLTDKEIIILNNAYVGALHISTGSSLSTACRCHTRHGGLFPQCRRLYYCRHLYLQASFMLEEA